MTSFLVLSAHDYRSPRQANIHFITEELARRGPTRFFSLKYSWLSQIKKNDWRTSLDSQANTIVRHKGVDCYLWKTPIHPFNVRSPKLQFIENALHHWYARGKNAVLQNWIKESDTIVLESGVAPIFFDLIKKLNPQAKILYRASDALDTVGVAPYVIKIFDRVAKDMHTLALPSRELANTMPSQHNLAYIPHGIDHALLHSEHASPYTRSLNAVSVGSMLFDADFIATASRLFPEVHFHVIGSGQDRHPDYGTNVSVYGETPFDQTIAYIKHADFGIAPYRNADLPVYLKDTSMKLIQYDFFGVPAVCPHFVAGNYASRFGYEPGNAQSIEQAVNRALASRQQIAAQKRAHLSWSEVTDRLLSPFTYNDTRLLV